MLDMGGTATCQRASGEEAQDQEALSQALVIVKAQGTGTMPREQRIQVAQAAGSSGKPFEKDRYGRVGRLGLRFDRTGRLMKAVGNNWA